MVHLFRRLNKIGGEWEECFRNRVAPDLERAFSEDQPDEIAEVEFHGWIPFQAF
jgi:hypothetical protein